MLGTNQLKKAIFGFKILYLIYLLLAFNSFVNAKGWMNLASYVITALGAVLILWMGVFYKRYRRVHNRFLLLAFVVSYCVSAAAHISYGLVENVKGLIWLLIPLIIVYASAFDMSREEIRREMRWLSGIYILYCTVANLVSLSMVYWGRMYEFQDKAGNFHVIGYRWNRLWGIYDDPNHGATITMIALFMLLYFLADIKKIWKKVLLFLVFIINYIYIVLSDSRTGIVGLAAGLLCGGLFWVFVNRGAAGRKALVRVAGVVGFTLVLAAGTFGVKTLYQPIDEKIVVQLNEKTKREAAEKNAQKNTANSTSKNTMGNTIKKEPNLREQDITEDYSNGRLSIWKDGLEIVASSPIIGVGFRNIVPYTLEHFPDNYLVNNEQEGQYDSLHNLELDILVSQGIVGILIFLALFVNICVMIVRRAGRIRVEDRKEGTLAFAAVASLGAAVTFLSFIFYVNAPQNFCFWLFLGYLMRICQLTEDEQTV